jgi:hypothetical protein
MWKVKAAVTSIDVSINVGMLIEAYFILFNCRNVFNIKQYAFRSRDWEEEKTLAVTLFVVKHFYVVYIQNNGPLIRWIYFAHHFL